MSNFYFPDGCRQDMFARHGICVQGDFIDFGLLCCW